MSAEWKDGRHTRSVEVQPEGQGHYCVRVDGAELLLAVEPLGEGRWRLVTPDGSGIAEITVVGTRRFVRLDGLDFVLEPVGNSRKRSSQAASGSLESPMPGIVTRVLVEAGATVEKGQPLVAVEAMKMEHLVRAPRAGIIGKVCVRAGELVPGGATLIELKESGSAA